MAIYRGSRYENSLVDFVATNDSQEALPVVFYSFTNFGLSSFIEYTVLQDERLDQIAYKFYRNTDLWWLLPEFNPSIKDTLTIPAGTILKIITNV